MILLSLKMGVWRMTPDLETWTPRQLLTTGPLTGRFVSVAPTDPERDAAALFAATSAGDPRLWDYLPYGPFSDEATFAAWLRTHVDDSSLLPRTIVDNETGLPVGNASFMGIDQDHGELEIGHIFFSPKLQRTRAATEAIYLMIRHAFDDFGYRRLVWKCDANNARSMRAAERFGYQHEGIWRQHRIVKGRNRDTAWFSIIDGEWPEVKAAFEEWLDDANIDGDGRQVRSLGEVREGSAKEWK
jgi:RimJ/RimL family protein N-acetyltransferase